ncbi:MAG TPA: SpoVA/SpoVAEb family sporulation membrane protein [Oscillospiraceae bacterium]|nr:SpoVA/SpoVAEb family sporulation membrane protein [Oscillospiraceae bacterium]HPS35181.1 SpoVA/SpoVAEb family sporulation membrane protein [Oscillospiraceae bacterium]
MFLKYLTVYAVGGMICLICQILIDKTKITPARILVTLIGLGVLLAAFGFSDAAVDAVGAGITAPIIGFGITLANGVKQAVSEKGALGVLTGGLTATSAGIAAVIVFAFLAAVLSKPREK